MSNSTAGIPKRNPNYLSLKLRAVALMREGVTPMTLFAVAICRLFNGCIMLVLYLNEKTLF